ncbi:MAG: DUF167 domain-containing protein [Parasphingorhabdus sp.]|uniref:DUF167 domain-containing protein n=1 Tax=Parasphingorhabdus sp. TaxID=2709688 RepID=UPI00300265B8
MAKKNHFPLATEILSLVKDGELTIKVVPNAGKNSIAMPKEAGPAGALLIRVTATPEDGKANIAVLKLLSKALRLPKSSLAIVRGNNARNKVITIPH